MDKTYIGTTLVLLAAGESERFGRRPKALLTHPSGYIMAVESVRGLSGYGRVVIAVRHLDFVETMQQEFAEGLSIVPDIYVVGATRSPLETARSVIQRARIAGPVAFKDCDNFFDHHISPNDYVATVDLDLHPDVRRDNKSFQNENTYTDVPGRFACAGLYSFKNVQTVLESDVNARNFYEIMPCFGMELVDNYLDWGTQEDWQKFRSKHGTMFVDIDGVLTVNGSRALPDKRWGATAVIKASIDKINAMYETGHWQIILVTSRPETRRQVTLLQLWDLKFHQLIMGLPAAHRILIGDDDSFGPSVHSVRMVRDSPDWSPVSELTGSELYG